MCKAAATALVALRMRCCCIASAAAAAASAAFLAAGAAASVTADLDIRMAVGAADFQVQQAAAFRYEIKCNGKVNVFFPRALTDSDAEKKYQGDRMALGAYLVNAEVKLNDVLPTKVAEVVWDVEYKKDDVLMKAPHRPTHA